MPCSEPVATIIVGANARNSFDSEKNNVFPALPAATRMPPRILSHGNHHLSIAQWTETECK